MGSVSHSSRRTSRVVTPALAVGAACALLLLAACGTTGASPESRSVAPLDLDGRTFAASELAGREVVAGSSVRLTFDDGRVSVEAGCNTMSAGAGWDQGVLVLDGTLATTMMACEDELMSQDAWLVSLLESRPRLTQHEGALVVGTDTYGMTLTEESR